MAPGARFLVLSALPLLRAVGRDFGIDPLLGGFIVTVPMAILGVALYRLVIERVQRIDPGLTIVATFRAGSGGRGMHHADLGPRPDCEHAPHTSTRRSGSAPWSVPRGPVLRLPARGGGHGRAAGHDSGAAGWGTRSRRHRRTRKGPASWASSPPRRRSVDLRDRHGQQRLRRRGAQLLVPVHPGFPGTSGSGLTLSVVILGGPGQHPRGRFAAGLLLGVAEAVTSTYISVRWSGRGAHAPHPGRAADPAAGAVHPGGPAGRGYVSATAARARGHRPGRGHPWPRSRSSRATCTSRNLLIMTFLLAIGGRRMEHHGRLRRLHLSRQ